RTKPNIQGGSSPNTNQRSFGVPRDATSPDGSFQRDSASSSLLAPRHHVGGKDVNSDRCASRPSPRTRRNTASSSSASASLMAEPTRVRVEFEDHRRLLTKSQRKDGLRRCWILLGPHLPTVADLAAHLARSFALHRSCPRGIRLFMDEFVLPPFESTSIFRDKDIIRRKKLNPSNTEKPIITAEPDENVLFEKNERFVRKRSNLRRILNRKDGTSDGDGRCDSLISNRLHQAHASYGRSQPESHANGKAERFIIPIKKSLAVFSILQSIDQSDMQGDGSKIAAPANNWEVAASVASAKSRVPMPQPMQNSEWGQMQQGLVERMKTQLQENGWDCWVANKVSAAPWPWAVSGRGAVGTADGSFGGKWGNHAPANHQTKRPFPMHYHSKRLLNVQLLTLSQPRLPIEAVQQIGQDQLHHRQREVDARAAPPADPEGDELKHSPHLTPPPLENLSGRNSCGLLQLAGSVPMTLALTKTLVPAGIS
ncbi:hypothetical protein MUK42_30039, partial [Musa troglodytarum]